MEGMDDTSVNTWDNVNTWDSGKHCVSTQSELTAPALDVTLSPILKLQTDLSPSPLKLNELPAEPLPYSPASSAVAAIDHHSLENFDVCNPTLPQNFIDHNLSSTNEPEFIEKPCIDDTRNLTFRKRRKLPIVPSLVYDSDHNSSLCSNFSESLALLSSVLLPPPLLPPPPPPPPAPPPLSPLPPPCLTNDLAKTGGPTHDVVTSLSNSTRMETKTKTVSSDPHASMEGAPPSAHSFFSLSLPSDRTTNLSKLVSNSLREMAKVKQLVLAVESRMDLIFADKVCVIDEHLADTLSQFENRFSEERRSIDALLSSHTKQTEDNWNQKLRDLDLKMNDCDCKFNTLQDKIATIQARLTEDSVNSMSPSSDPNTNPADLEEKFTALRRDFSEATRRYVDEYLNKKEMDVEPLFENEYCRRFDSRISSSTSALALRIDSLQAELDDYKTATDFQSNSDNLTVKVHPLLSDINVIGKKIDLLTKWITSLQTDIQAKGKILDNLDLKSRGLNLLLDGLPEIPNEDTPAYTCGL